MKTRRVIRAPGLMGHERQQYTLEQLLGVIRAPGLMGHEKENPTRMNAWGLTC